MLEPKLNKLEPYWGVLALGTHCDELPHKDQLPNSKEIDLLCRSKGRLQIQVYSNLVSLIVKPQAECDMKEGVHSETWRGGQRGDEHHQEGRKLRLGSEAQLILSTCC